MPERAMRAIRAMENAPRAVAGRASGPGEESRVLHPQRIVERQKGAKLPDVLLSRRQGQKETRGIPGQVKQPEHDHGYDEEDEDTLEKTAAQVGEHSTALPSS